MINILTYSIGSIVENVETPTVEVKIHGTRAGYLSLFRNYRFQISVTEDGLISLGEGSVLMYKSFVKSLERSEAIELFKGQAMIALENMCSNTRVLSELKLRYRDGECVITSPRDIKDKIKFYNGDDLHTGFNDFIGKCYDYLIES